MLYFQFLDKIAHSNSKDLLHQNCCHFAVAMCDLKKVGGYGSNVQTDHSEHDGAAVLPDFLTFSKVQFGY